MSDTEECSVIVELGLGTSSPSTPKQIVVPHTNPNIIGEASVSSRRRTEISDGKSYPLPHDLLMEIIRELPVKSLLRFLCVSKLWRSTILSRDFRYAFLTNSLARPQRQCLLFTFTCGDKCFVFSSPLPENADEASSSSVATYIMTCHSPSRVCLAPSVHGLICYGPASGLVIYNPCTRRSIVLPKINSGNKKINHYIGYDPIDGCYKVLCVTSGSPEMGNKLGLAEELCVLTLGNEQQQHSWRMVENIPPHSPTCHEMCINGVLYYGAFIGADLTKPAIMSFDVRSEAFGLIKGPDIAGVNFLSSSKLTSYEGKLSVLFFEDEAIVWWVLEDGASENWSNNSCKLPSLVGWTTTHLNLQLFSGTNAGEVILAPVFVRESTYRVVYYDPKRNRFRRIEVKGITDSEVPDKVDNWWFCRAISVFPALVDNLMFL